MTIHVNRHGIAIETQNQTVISLGWNIWGIDFMDGRHFMFHVYPFRLFIERRTRNQRG